MKQVKRKLLRILLFAATALFSLTAIAQEFRGFYSSNDRARNSATLSRYYRPGYDYKHSGYLPSNSMTLRIADNRNSEGLFYATSDDGRFAYPAREITINIFSPEYTNYAGRPAYGYPNRYNDEIPFGAKIIKINGERFYEMNGNYYRADRYANTGNVNYRPNNRDEKYYFVAEDNDAVYSSLNPGYLKDGSDRKTIVVTKGNNAVYANKKDVDNTIATLQQEKRTLQSENDALKQKEEYRLKMYKDKLTTESQPVRMKISSEEQNDMEQQAKEIEQMRRLQKMRQDNEMQELQEAQKQENRRRKEEQKNNKTDQDVFYRNVSIGDTVEQVPPGSKTITIDGKKTYLSPANIYYQKQKNGKYMVVGMEGK